MKRGAQFRKAPTETIELYWRFADELTQHSKRAMYLFRKQNGREILYIGKAYYQSIKHRWECKAKGRLAKLARKEKVQLRPFIAGVHTSRKITPKLLDDIERLLIFLVRPRWNVPRKQSCTLHHRDLVIRCSGYWPYPRTEFSYYDDFPWELSFRSR